MVNKQTHCKLSPINDKGNHWPLWSQKSLWQDLECPKNNLNMMDRLDFMVVCSFIIAAKLSQSIRNHVEIGPPLYFGKAQIAGNLCLAKFQTMESNTSK